jgi:hypothetical protein
MEAVEKVDGFGVKQQSPGDIMSAAAAAMAS